MDSTKQQPLLSMKLSLDWRSLGIGFIIYIVNMTVGVTGAVLYTIFSETNNSFGTEKKAFIAICYVAFECFMMLILFLLAKEDWKKLFILPHQVHSKAEDCRIHYIPDHIVWQSIAILFVNYFHLAVEHRVYKTAGGNPAFIFANSLIFAIIFGSLQSVGLYYLVFTSDADSVDLIRKRILNQHLI
ncbi:hypothetical protein WN944_024145 [Citrus x changshan-huyou]|uniref:Uncharacterized protein n=1 Tax=Citrus x changshan-huyou TaxID=2935761 RepID=A0AAP0QAD9_9ROSI